MKLHSNHEHRSKVMSSEARNHHYVPQSYLRGFAHRRGKKPRLVVADLHGRRFFESTPRNVASERDFNRFEAPGHKPDFLETMWSEFEGKVAEAIQQIDQSGTFEGESRTLVLNFAALLAVRHPAMRENMRSFQEKVAKMMLGMTVATEERWNSSIEGMEKQSDQTPPSVPYEVAKAFVEADKYKIEVPRERHIQMEMTMFEKVLPLLAKRNWSLFQIPDQQMSFITADRPLVLMFRNPDKVPAMYRHSPGFGLQDTEVLLPLSRKSVIAGTFDQSEIRVDAHVNVVANANTKVIAHAPQHLYCCDSKFPYFGPDGQVFHDRLFFERMPASG